jgi:hypothetical protein
MAKARKMVALNIEETSGVDHPAHLHEGWLVIKSENLTGVDDLLSDLSDNKNNSNEFQKGTEEEAMAETNNVEVTSEVESTIEVDKAMHEDKKKKSMHEDKKKMSYDEMMKKIKMLEDELATAKGKLKKSEDDEVVIDTASLVKEAPEPLRKMLQDLEKSAAEATARANSAEEVLKAERVARADSESIEKAKAWKFLGLDAEKIGPALRQLAEINEELAKSFEDALNSVNAQAESANIFAEIGKSSTPTNGSAYEQLTSMAKAVAGTDGVTFEQAFANAVSQNTDLYNQYLNEKGAK